VKILREILLALLRRWGGTAEVRKSSGEPFDKLRELTWGCPRLFCVLLAVLGGVALEHSSSRRGQKGLPSLSWGFLEFWAYVVVKVPLCQVR